MREKFATISPAALREHVVRLTVNGPRHRGNPASVTAALDYMTKCLSSYGYAVEPERYGAAPHEVNLLTEVLGDSAAPVLEVGAHWDSVRDAPGADDNASGIAGLLELARVFAGAAPATRALRFCAFGGEEDQPVGCTGSRAHVARLGAGGGPLVEGAIVLEMIAYRDTRPGSQRFPEPEDSPQLDLSLLDRGDFIAAVGNEEAAQYLAALHSGGQSQTPALMVLPVSLPSSHSANGARSDHYPYWLSGRRGVMVTDTAEFRNPHYHRATDTVDTLDFDFAAQVTRAVAQALHALTG
jgi:Zn-dependent M28 family amino/carboxypeptidase